MNNLHRDLAPVSAPAWEEIEEEARQTFELHIAGRRVVDLTGPEGAGLAAVGTGHLTGIEPPLDGVRAQARASRPVVELRVPFTVSRAAVDDVERGSRDSDWQPVKDAARTLALAEDRAVFEGYRAASIEGIRAGATNPPVPLPEDVREYPEAVSRALTSLRLAGVGGPYSLLLGAAAFTAVNETSDHGYPVHNHLARLLDGDIIWAPAIEGAFLLSTRGGDFELVLGQDVSVGYLAHDADTVRLYLQESLTFRVHTGEAAVALGGTEQGGGPDGPRPPGHQEGY
ncbi:family 1 encapsulin nanocompartment shell protein [Kitasatospora sp. NPDC059577]|uniref:family 1 encapsulin nanocompartment shell protein n=1 Tax=unclassified Kitasatospora TaxID=2633591 RepID=UPI0036795C3C